MFTCASLFENHCSQIIKQISRKGIITKQKAAKMVVISVHMMGSGVLSTGILKAESPVRIVHKHQLTEWLSALCWFPRT